MIKWLKNLFSTQEQQKQLAELYISMASSLEEVERRQRQIDRGEADYQKFYR